MQHIFRVFNGPKPSHLKIEFDLGYEPSFAQSLSHDSPVELGIVIILHAWKWFS